MSIRSEIKRNYCLYALVAQWHVGALSNVCSRASSDPFALKTPCLPLSSYIAASRRLVLSYARFFLTVFSSSCCSFQKPAFFNVNTDCHPREKTDFDLISYSLSSSSSSLLHWHWDSGSSWKGLPAVVFLCVLNLGSSSNSSRNGKNDRFEAPPNFAEPVGAGFLQSTSSRSALSAPKALLGPDFWRGSLWALLRDRKERPLGAFSLGSLPKGGIRLQGKIRKVENSWNWSQFVHNRNKKLITVCSVHNHNISASQHAVNNIFFSLLMCCHHMSNYFDDKLSSYVQITLHLCRGLPWVRWSQHRECSCHCQPSSARLLLCSQRGQHSPYKERS